MVSIEDREEIYRVPIGNNGDDEYVFRGLRADEVEIWSEFCASVFSYKTNPPPAEYFYRHCANDPSTKAIGSSKLIRVAIFDNKIVASCRIFLRTISAGKKRKYINAGGIGEVCTAVDHRRRGISKKLLETAIAIMEEKPGIEVSSLHAAKTFFPLYESLGYESSPPTNPLGGNRWSTVTYSTYPWNNNYSLPRIFSDSNNEMNRKLHIRPAKFPTDTESLQELHASYSEERFAGCIRRSQEYWNDYLSKELEGSMFVLVLKRKSFSSPGRDCEMSEQILSWLSLSRSKGNADRDYVPSFNVVEFGMDAPFIESDTFLSKKSVVGALVAHAIEENLAARESDSNPSTNPNPNSSASVDQGPSNSGNHYSKSKAEKHLDNWDQIEHKVTKFPKIIRNVDYLPWKETFIAYLKVERMLFFTDPDPQFDKDNIINGYELELYDRKNDFFWLILLHSIQNPTARAILNKFKCDEPDARAAFLAIDERMRDGVLQMSSTSTALEELDALNIQTFTGTRTAFLTLVFEKLRIFSMIVDERMNYFLARYYVEKAVKADPDLSRFFNEVEVPKDRNKAFDLMYESLFDRAISRDATHARTKQRIATNNHLMEQQLEQHQGYQDYLSNQDDYETYKSRLDSSFKIPDHVYSNLSQEGKIVLRNMSDDDRWVFFCELAHEAKQSREQYDFIEDDDLSSELVDNVKDFPNENKVMKSNKSPVRPPPSNSANFAMKRKPFKSELGKRHPAVIMADDRKREVPRRSAYNVEAEPKIINTGKKSFSLQLPSFLADEIRCDNFERDANDSVFSFDWASERTHTDHGWMYRGVGKSANGLDKSESEPLTSIPVEFLCFNQTEHPMEHFVWPSDSF